MQRVQISQLVQRPWSLMVIMCLCLLFLYVLVQGGQQHRQPGSGELDKLRDEAAKLREQIFAQNEMNKKLQDQNRDLQSKINKMQGNLHGCWNVSVKYGELVEGLNRSLENYEDQNLNLQEEIFAQNEMIKKLQDQNRDLQSKTDKMKGNLHGCWNVSVKYGELVQGLNRSLENYEDQNLNLQEEISAQNEMIGKLQDQNRDLQSKIDKMQGDLQRCRTESGKHGELVQELKRNLKFCGNHISDLQYSQGNCWSQSFKSQDDNIWWLILPFVLGCSLGCCLGWCKK